MRFVESWVGATLLGLAVGCQSTPPLPPPRFSEVGEANLLVTPLAALDSGFDSTNAIVVSKDLLHFAYPTARGTGKAMVIDGSLSDSYDKITWFEFSPDGEHHAFVAGKPWVLVRDGVEGPAYDAILTPGLSSNLLGLSPMVAVSQTSKSPWKVAYIARRGEDYVVVHGDQEIARSKLIHSVVQNSNGSRLAYVESFEGQERVVLDGKPQEPVYRVLALSFSPDGHRFAFRAQRSLATFQGFPEEVQSLSVDGKKLAECQEIREFQFSPDSQSLSYVARSGQGSIVTSYAESVEPTDSGPSYAWISGLTYSPDGKHLAYAATDTVGQDWIVIDRQAYPAPGSAEALRFSPDGTRIAFQIGSQVFVETLRSWGTDRRSWPTSDGFVGSYAWSPDGRLVIMRHSRIGQNVSGVLSRAGKESVVVDGVEGKAYDAVGQPVFSPDGKRMAYWALEGAKAFVVVDGREFGDFRVTSPRDAKDGALAFYNQQLIFTSPNDLQTIAIKDQYIVRVEIEW